MTFAHINHFSWIAAALIAAFMLELSGAFRVGAAEVFVPLMLILLTGFFGVRWFAGLLALILLILSFFVAPFWVLEVGGVALTTLLLLIAAPFLTGNKLSDFLILLGVGTCIVTVFGGLIHGGVSLETVLFSLVMNLAVGACAFVILDRNISPSRSFTS